MNTVIPVERNEAYETLAKVDVLRTLEPLVEDLMEDHLRKRKLWFPSDFLPADEQMDEDEERKRVQLRERARGLPDHLRVAVALNLLTEEGLPHFHRVISNYLGNDNPWSTWNFLWTAEEDRHGTLLHDYARDARLFRMREIEQMQYAYVNAGFTPEWESDPYRIFVYTTLQERATQVSHRNTGHLAKDHEPMLQGILSSIAADEARHYVFYRGVFEAILKLDPNRALESALTIMPSLEMPGSTMPGYTEMADIVRRCAIYDAWEYKSIVEEAIHAWNIGGLESLSSAGCEAQEKIMAIPARLDKLAKWTERRDRPKTFYFEFVYGRPVEMQ
jgi:acyl-[acyl-carrier-protein] desaturase